jgi:hypothetical protein
VLRRRRDAIAAAANVGAADCDFSDRRDPRRGPSRRPVGAGVVVFGDPIGDDALSVALRSLAFVLVVIAAALIPAPTRTSTSPRRAPEPSRAT